MTPDRDASVEQLLRRTRRDAQETAPDADCLETETLAAWVDGGLIGPELARAEAHVAGCARCQAMLAVIVRSTPAAAEPEPWWRRHFGLGWLVPLTAGAAAIALWVAVPRVNAPPVPLESAVKESAQVQAVPQAEPSPMNETPAGADGFRAAPPARAEPRPSAEADPGRRDEERAELKAESFPSPVGVTPDPTANVGQLADSRAAAPAAPTMAAESAALSAGRTTQMARAAEPGRSIASFDPRTAWRFGGPGVVQRSIDGGVSWESLSTGSAEELTAGAAPSATVCWLVGRRGIVLRTIDGRRLERVPSPDTSDLIGVQATDARTASVTAADGRIFRTTDGGVTWISAAPQDF